MPTVHVISASVTVEWQQLAMCGLELGTYREAIEAGHMVGNYATRDAILERSTCDGCKARF